MTLKKTFLVFDMQTYLFEVLESGPILQKFRTRTEMRDAIWKEERSIRRDWYYGQSAFYNVAYGTRRRNHRRKNSKQHCYEAYFANPNACLSH